MVHVVVQAGHYPRKTGATGTGGVDGDPTEQEFAIHTAHTCHDHLVAAGHSAVVIGADVNLASYRGDVFVAIHCDGSTSPSARGASVGYQNEQGRDIATAWKHAYHEHGWLGGWRPDNYTAALSGYYGVRNARSQGNHYAFIAEAGFLTNPSDEAALSFPHGPIRFARALTEAVVSIFGGSISEPISEPIRLPEDDEMYIITNKEHDQGIWVSMGESFIHLAHHETVSSILASGVKTQEWMNADFQALVEAKSVDDLTLQAAERSDLRLADIQVDLETDQT